MDKSQIPNPNGSTTSFDKLKDISPERSRGTLTIGTERSRSAKSQINANYQITKLLRAEFLSLFIICNFVLVDWNLASLYAKESKGDSSGQEAAGPLVVNGDTVEYSTDSKVFSASGNVVVIYKGIKLYCQKLSLNSATKEGEAEGKVRLEEESGVIEGDKIKYNFETKKGTIFDAQFRANPFFGRAEKEEKVSDSEFIAYRGYMTTCSYDNPHYRMKSRKMDFFPGDKVQIKDSLFYLGKVPLLYLPQYTRSFKDPFMQVQLVPGNSKDWGLFMLSAWRYNLTEDLKGRLYFDYRWNVGMAEGFGTNYDTQDLGRGDFKFYYSHEKLRVHEEGAPFQFQRYLVRLRHKWEIDEMTNAVVEYYKIVDSKRAVLGSGYNLLKDYFPREYLSDSQPLSYVLLHRSFNHSSLDFLLQKRTNPWYTQLEKLPEIKYSLPSLRIARSPLYFQTLIEAANYNFKNAVPSPSTDDVSMIRFDTSNKFSLPLKISFLRLTPFVQNELTYYKDGDILGASIPPRTVFSGGSDISTKFYRIFNIKTNFLGLDINALRHIITPTISYSYTHSPSISSSRLKQIDSIDSITHGSSASLELTNKLQTKRNNQTVDLLNFRINSAYLLKPKEEVNKGGTLSDLILKLEIMPYSWMSVISDATYQKQDGFFSQVNYDLNFNLAAERTIGIGQRYKRKGSNEITLSLNWRLNPKWKFSFYSRSNIGSITAIKNGIIEQEYTLTRDLHCWSVELSYNITKESGQTIWGVFRLKAFPELEFDFSKHYSPPRPGSQS